jgi:hypothetical protein
MRLVFPGRAADCSIPTRARNGSLLQWIVRRGIRKWHGRLALIFTEYGARGARSKDVGKHEAAAHC